jgi:eukaryotic-like serine/threonine-protein kinase
MGLPWRSPSRRILPDRTRSPDDLERRFPEDTSVRFSYLPAVRACLALNQSQPSRAIELLEAAVGYELGTPRTGIHANFGALYPVYMRGEGYLAAHQGAEAAAEFQKILDHRGIVVSDPIGALADLQLGRAYALEAGIDVAPSQHAGPAHAAPKGGTTPDALVKAKSAYQDFLTLWKDADPDVPILTQARAGRPAESTENSP